MTETQFTELMARLDNVQLMVFLGICFLLVCARLDGGRTKINAVNRVHARLFRDSLYPWLLDWFPHSGIQESG